MLALDTGLFPVSTPAGSPAGVPAAAGCRLQVAATGYVNQDYVVGADINIIFRAPCSHRVPRRPVLSDVNHGIVVPKYGACAQQENRRLARRSAFAYHKVLILECSPDDSGVSVGSDETLNEPTVWKPIDIVAEQAYCSSAPIDNDDDNSSEWSFETGDEAAFTTGQFGTTWSEEDTEATWSAPAASWALSDCPIEIDENESTPESHGEVTLVESPLETSRSDLAESEEITPSKVAEVPCAIADIPTSNSSIDSLVAEIIAVATLYKGLPQLVVSGGLQADSEFELPKTAPLALSKPIAQTPSDDLVIQVEEVDKSKTTLLLTRAKAKLTSFTGHASPILKSTLMFNGVQTAVYATPLSSHETLTMENKKYRLDGGAIIKAYSPIVYQSIRTLCGIDCHEFLNSFVLQSDLTKTKSPGKSGSDFLFTPDGKYIIKTIKRKEHNVIANSEFLADYYNHVKAQSSTQLPFYLGNYTLVAGGKKTHFVIMKNLLQKETQLIYDLKGSTHDRRAGPRKDNRGRVVFKDLDWTDKHEAIFMSQEDRDKLMVQVSKDVDFLKQHNIMDYSLLVGLQSDTRTCQQQPVIGMIDTLCPFSWRKRAETISKSLIFGSSAIDVVHPSKYGARFLNFVQSAVVPRPGRSVSTRC
ncbi:1-phosphatidylinositol-4-phosphate 5-kinase [Sugiyamaella lignohabitans]|uniref:1-phosphatidylinositol-4-phosphate 5-kinase n=1 Tax=Sugiyamaella lignohabitans TaxID=796027 RepID=A0A161HFE4_9ASCO|nr:1-phosphatidylinositol-4-phosphate 5-kinase [Sugiyamaella lignohabitans]ANB11231.1 1-phosphatidylinositol-4-phosphate 5-kinase [Sugiyamaella lignohabitans]